MKYLRIITTILLLLFIGYVIYSLVFNFPRDRWITAKVVKVDCTDGFSTEPRIVLEENGVDKPYLISKGWCLVGTLYLNQIVQARINWSGNIVVEIKGVQ